MSRRVAKEAIPELPEHSQDAVEPETSDHHSEKVSRGMGMNSSDPKLAVSPKTYQPSAPCGLKRHKSLTYTSQTVNGSQNSRHHSEPRMVRSISTPLEVPSEDTSFTPGMSSPTQRWNPFKTMCNIPNPEALRCKRLYIRRNALCDPEKMPMPQETRERVQRDVEHRKHSWRRKMTVYIRLKLGTDGEVDLF